MANKNITLWPFALSLRLRSPAPVCLSVSHPSHFPSLPSEFLSFSARRQHNRGHNAGNARSVGGPDSLAPWDLLEEGAAFNTAGVCGAAE